MLSARTLQKLQGIRQCSITRSETFVEVGWRAVCGDESQARFGGGARVPTGSPALPYTAFSTARGASAPRPPALLGLLGEDCCRAGAMSAAA